MQTKICGIRNIEDAKYCVKHGADAIGFVFHKNSPRFISSDDVLDIVLELPPLIHKVGLFVNHSSEEINSIMQKAKLSIAQIHKKVSDDFLSEIKYPYMQVLRLKNSIDLENIPKNSYYLVDAFVESFGGEGVKINLDIFKNIDCSKFILAGGLTSEYLPKLKEYNFYGVDVSSGVESSKGVKSHKKIKDFLEVAKKITSSN